MSADELRQAAATLRARAEAATPGPWESALGAAPRVLGSREPEDLGGGLASILRANLPLINGRARREANVSYAATTHPGVGLALADWLDEEADMIADWDPAIGAYCESGPALTVARLINGGAS